MTQSLETAEGRLRSTREVLADLISRRGRLDSEFVALTGDREEAAYGALTGDAAAKKRFDAVTKRLSALRDDESALRAAITTAQSHVSDAEADFSRFREAESAKRALGLTAGSAFCPRWIPRTPRRRPPWPRPARSLPQAPRTPRRVAKSLSLRSRRTRLSPKDGGFAAGKEVFEDVVLHQ